MKVSVRLMPSGRLDVFNVEDDISSADFLAIIGAQFEIDGEFSLKFGEQIIPASVDQQLSAFGVRSGDRLRLYTGASVSDGGVYAVASGVSASSSADNSSSVVTSMETDERTTGASNEGFLAVFEEFANIFDINSFERLLPLMLLSWLKANGFQCTNIDAALESFSSPLSDNELKALQFVHNTDVARQVRINLVYIEPTNIASAIQVGGIAKGVDGKWAGVGGRLLRKCDWIDDNIDGYLRSGDVMKAVKALPTLLTYLERQVLRPVKILCVGYDSPLLNVLRTPYLGEKLLSYWQPKALLCVERTSYFTSLLLRDPRTTNVAWKHYYNRDFPDKADKLKKAGTSASASSASSSKSDTTHASVDYRERYRDAVEARRQQRAQHASVVVRRPSMEFQPPTDPQQPRFPWSPLTPQNPPGGGPFPDPGYPLPIFPPDPLNPFAGGELLPNRPRNPFAGGGGLPRILPRGPRPTHPKRPGFGGPGFFF